MKNIWIWFHQNWKKIIDILLFIAVLEFILILLPSIPKWLHIKAEYLIAIASWIIAIGTLAILLRQHIWNEKNSRMKVLIKMVSDYSEIEQDYFRTYNKILSENINLDRLLQREMGEIDISYIRYVNFLNVLSHLYDKNHINRELTYKYFYPILKHFYRSDEYFRNRWLNVYPELENLLDKWGITKLTPFVRA